MDLLVLVVVLVVVIAILVGLFVLFRRRQRSGDVLATSGPGTSKETDR
ncbi:MAG: hypothetical protein OEW83_20990 [Acidimicrobiia bacterium]|nr:hypothetical protein [Acidimicrobiia bacterium]